MTAEYHPHPNPHFVIDTGTWERLKAKLGDAVKPEVGMPTAGVSALLTGVAVYLDDCPWDCEAAP